MTPIGLKEKIRQVLLRTPELRQRIERIGMLEKDKDGNISPDLTMNKLQTEIMRGHVITLRAALPNRPFVAAGMKDYLQETVAKTAVLSLANIIKGDPEKAAGFSLYPLGAQVAVESVAAKVFEQGDHENGVNWNFEADLTEPAAFQWIVRVKADIPLTPDDLNLLSTALHQQINSKFSHATVSVDNVEYQMNSQEFYAIQNDLLTLLQKVSVQDNPFPDMAPDAHRGVRLN